MNESKEDIIIGLKNEIEELLIKIQDKDDELTMAKDRTKELEKKLSEIEEKEEKEYIDNAILKENKLKEEKIILDNNLTREIEENKNCIDIEDKEYIEIPDEIEEETREG